MEGITRASIKGNHVALRANPGDIGNAANVHKDHRALGHGCGKGAVIDRHKRGALPAGGHIGGADIIDNGHA